ncbi:MAG: adenylate/guanylate cyclase domain-containing protein [Bacteroidetes bacterium]|nr:adenylate/guanylate cyclase domain-containing protein [Bacteroidota bacterium]
MVTLINRYYRAFDAITERHNLEKIKTIGDAYMAVGGLPRENISNPWDVINAAIDIENFMKVERLENPDRSFEVRIGVHTGPVVAGIVGVKKFAYDIWGDTVNTASRMEQHGEAGKINISETTYELIKDKFNCTYRGEVEAKNKGKLKMYFVDEAIPY